MTNRGIHASDAAQPECDGSTSASLIRRVKIRDEEACRRLLDLYVPSVYSWCRRSGMQAQDAADVVQEVFRAVFRGIDGLRYQRPGDTFRGWLRTIIRNKIHDHFNRRAAQPVAFGGSEAQQRFMQLAADQPRSSVGPGPLGGLLRRALDLIRGEFEDRTRQAFWLATVQQQSSADIAQRLGTTPGAVRQAKYKVLRRLRQELGDLD